MKGLALKATPSDQNQVPFSTNETKPEGVSGITAMKNVIRSRHFFSKMLDKVGSHLELAAQEIIGDL